ncbi:hypothetical protein [Reticulibacter mediterranei]|nr:hypothetical protein [Reticulibacter mediterranei]
MGVVSAAASTPPSDAIARGRKIEQMQALFEETGFALARTSQ